VNRTIALFLALVFIVGFAVLTIATIDQEGLNGASVIAIFILLLLAVGVIGAARNPPR
jgi:quinol-cytochrome oxidoreductase complex cytochrome b subunit